MFEKLLSTTQAPVWLWWTFTLSVIILLVIDLGLFHFVRHKKGSRFAIYETLAWISVALLFGGYIHWSYGSRLATEYLTGYVVEKTLSLDNIFVILLIFQAFRVDAKHQHRILFYGVLGAVIMRGVLILVGAQLLQQFHWLMYVFGGILLITAVKLLRGTDETKSVLDSPMVARLKRWLPTTDDSSSGHFFTRQNGVLLATPLFLALIVVEITDLIFAVDSIPAVLAVTDDAFIAFASNILAVLGLRALYFVLAEQVAELRYLKPGLAAVLGFVGLKMLVSDFYKVPGWASLLVIAFILMTAGLSSWYVARSENQRQSP
ncbi:MAG: TerC/Alx family metal homeostasis membrane protein [Bdellovibrionales bacterium]